MGDPIREFDETLRGILRDAYDIGDTDAETLLEVALTCAKTSGVVTGVATGGTFGLIGGTVTVGTLTVPAWVAGALAGFVGGTAVCTIQNFSGSMAIDRFLKSTGHTQQQFKTEVHTLLRRHRPLKSTPLSSRQRYRLPASPLPSSQPA